MARAALLAASALCLAAILMLVPMPSFRLWLVRFTLRETSLALVALALVAVFVAGLGQRRAPRAARAALLLSLTAGIAAGVPLISLAPEYESARAPFSLREYVLGVDAPAIAPRAIELAPGVRAEVYGAAGGDARPLVVVVHGGSWQRGAPGEAPHMSRALAGAGFIVADVAYRLAPTHRFPAGVADVKCAVGRLRERAGELGLDPGRVALLGRSAGGQVALVAAYSAGDPRVSPSCGVPDEPVSAVVSLYAPTDLVWGHDHPPTPDPLDGPASIEAYLGGTPAERPDAYRLASPASWADRPLPRTFIVHGAGDQLVRAEHGRRLASALAAAGQATELLLLPFADHGFDRRPGGAAEQLARQRVLSFLRMLQR
jgi:acetyl esterase/lipase